MAPRARGLGYHINLETFNTQHSTKNLGGGRCFGWDLAITSNKTKFVFLPLLMLIIWQSDNLHSTTGYPTDFRTKLCCSKNVCTRTALWSEWGMIHTTVYMPPHPHAYCNVQGARTYGSPPSINVSGWCEPPSLLDTSNETFVLHVLVKKLHFLKLLHWSRSPPPPPKQPVSYQ